MTNPVRPNVILIGYRGTGKSSVAKIIAQRTGRALLHMDNEIAKRAGMSIPELVNAHGWQRFRDLEAAIAAEAGSLRNTVVDCGGGVVSREENMKHLASSGTIFWLSADAATITQRLHGQNDRPSLTGNKSFLDEIEDVLRERTPLYRKWANHEIPTAGQTVADIAASIVAILASR